jgi:hypothetical protein
VLKERPYPLKANGDPMVVALEQPAAPAAKDEKKEDKDGNK